MAVDISGFLSRLEAWAGQVTEVWVDGATEALREEAPVAAPTGDPRQRPPGTLARALRHDPVTGSAPRFSGTVIAPGIEAVTTAKGAAPHVISARRGGVLMWYSGGQPAFARQVDHPGNAGTNWFQDGLAKVGQPTLSAAAQTVPFR